MAEIIHNKYFRSGPDDIQLGLEIEIRFVELCETYKRIKGKVLLPPTDLHKDFVLWRVMRMRHKKGDARHTEDEMKATQAVAQWTVDIHRELRGQSPVRVVWG